VQSEDKMSTLALRQRAEQIEKRLKVLIGAKCLLGFFKNHFSSF
jgi:hypothetical protein